MIKKIKNYEILSDVKTKSCFEDVNNQKQLSKLEIKVDEVSPPNKTCYIVETKYYTV